MEAAINSLKEQRRICCFFHLPSICVAHLRTIDCEMLRLTGVSGEGCGMCSAAQVGECIFAVLVPELMLRREV